MWTPELLSGPGTKKDETTGTWVALCTRCIRANVEAPPTRLRELTAQEAELMRRLSTASGTSATAGGSVASSDGESFPGTIPNVPFEVLAVNNATGEVIATGTCVRTRE